MRTSTGKTTLATWKNTNPFNHLKRCSTETTTCKRKQENCGTTWSKLADISLNLLQPPTSSLTWVLVLPIIKSSTKRTSERQADSDGEGWAGTQWSSFPRRGGQTLHRCRGSRWSKNKPIWDKEALGSHRIHVQPLDKQVREGEDHRSGLLSLLSSVPPGHQAWELYCHYADNYILIMLTIIL